MTGDKVRRAFQVVRPGQTKNPRRISDAMIADVKLCQLRLMRAEPFVVTVTFRQHPINVRLLWA